MSCGKESTLILSRGKEPATRSANELRRVNISGIVNRQTTRIVCSGDESLIRGDPEKSNNIEKSESTVGANREEESGASLATESGRANMSRIASKQDGTEIGSGDTDAGRFGNCKKSNNHDPGCKFDAEYKSGWVVVMPHYIKPMTASSLAGAQATGCRREQEPVTALEPKVRSSSAAKLVTGAETRPRRVTMSRDVRDIAEINKQGFTSLGTCEGTNTRSRESVTTSGNARGLTTTPDWTMNLAATGWRRAQRLTTTMKRAEGLTITARQGENLATKEMIRSRRDLTRLDPGVPDGKGAANDSEAVANPGQDPPTQRDGWNIPRQDPDTRMILDVNCPDPDNSRPDHLPTRKVNWGDQPGPAGRKKQTRIWSGNSSLSQSNPLWDSESRPARPTQSESSLRRQVSRVSMLSGDDGPDFMFPHLRPDWDIDSLLIILLLILSCLSVLFAVQKYFGGIFQAVLSSAGTTHPEKKRSSLDYRLESTVCWLAATLLMMAIALIMRNVVALSYLTLSSQWYFYLSLHLRSQAWNKPTQSYTESGLTYSKTGLYLLLLSYGCKRVWNLLRQLVSVVTSATHHQLHRQRLIPQLIAHVSYPPASLVVVTAL